MPPGPLQHPFPQISRTGSQLSESTFPHSRGLTCFPESRHRGPSDKVRAGQGKPFYRGIDPLQHQPWTLTSHPALTQSPSFFLHL